MKHFLFILTLFFSVVTCAQIQPEILFNDCAMIVVNDTETTPYLDTLMYHFNFTDENLFDEHQFVNILEEKDFTCVKSYEVVHNNGQPIISFRKPNIHCYEIGWTRISIVHVGYFFDSCGVSTTNIFLLP